MTNGKGDNGFTLIEIISVCLIIGLLFALATARLDFLIPHYNLRATARKIGNLARIANSHAITSGKDLYIVYELAEGEYYLLVPQKRKPKEEKSLESYYEYQKLFKENLPKGISFLDIILQDGKKITSGRAIVRVSPYGFSNHHIVNLKDSSGDHMAIKFNGLTGGLTFYDEYKEGVFSIEETE
jgi:prepilin-type N-terminal cleavage/methylation domain-containing protein